MRIFFRIVSLLLVYGLAPLHAQLPPPDEPAPEDQPKAAEEEVEKVVEELKKGDLADEPFKISISGEVDLNYVFAESPDTFIVTYKFSIEGLARNKVDILKGKGQITTGITGSLAKWPTGECALNISVGELPFEMVFNKVSEEMIRLDVKLTGDVLENWESNCTFRDAPGSKFHTSGNPEKWVIRALKRPNPSFMDLTVPVDRLHKRTSTMEFQIERFLIPDPPLGSAELEGKGKIEISPETL